MKSRIFLRDSTDGEGGRVRAVLRVFAIVLAGLCLSLTLASCLGGPTPVEQPAAAQPEARPDLGALISAKDASGIKDFFKNRELLDTPDADGYYPLHRAVQQDSADVVDLLAALGARLESVDSRGRTPLRLAVELGEAGCAKVLADRGASIFAKDSSGTTAAAIALAKGGDIFASVFNSRNINQRSPDGTTALHIAADSLLEDAARKLLDLGADPALKNQAGRLPVDMALLHPDRIESARIAELLIQRGPSPSFPEFAWFAQAARAMNYATLRFEDGNTPLHEAVAARQKGFVEFLLSRKANPNARNTAGSAPLHEAVRSGWLDGAALLLKGGADPNVRDGFDNTPLHIALPETGREACVDLLLSSGADPSLKDRNGNIPLHIAVQVGYSTALVDRLLKAGSPANAANAAGDTALHLALRGGRLEYVPLLLSNGADIFLANGKGETPLSMAIASANAAPGTAPQAGKADPFAALQAVVTPANVGSRDNLGNTPLHLAVSLQASPQSIAIIASRGADVNARNNAGDSPLHLAVRKNWKAQGEAILQAKADIFASNVKGETPLSIALASPLPVDWLFNSQTIVARDTYGDTPLHHAARLNFDKAIDFLCLKGADPNARNSDGATPLAAAVKADAQAAASALLKDGASLAARDAMGDTALHIAVLWSARRSLPVLMDAGADPDARNLSGESPLHQATKKRDVESLRFLMGRGASVQARDNRGATPLFVAAKSGAADAARLLIASGAEIDARDLAGRSPLAAAVESGEADCARLLVAAGASILARDAEGECPLTMAARRSPALVDALVTPANANQADADGKAPLRVLIDAKAPIAAIELVLSRGGLVNARDRDSRTALHAAYAMGDLVCAARLAGAGADIFATDRNGVTPVSLAMDSGLEALKAILGGGRAKNLDPMGQSLLHYAARAGKPQIADWLLSEGVDKSTRNILGETAADIAEKRGFAELAAKLR
jgi:ankyrin repeat protein